MSGYNIECVLGKTGVSGKPIFWGYCYDNEYFNGRGITKIVFWGGQGKHTYIRSSCLVYTDLHDTARLKVKKHGYSVIDTSRFKETFPAVVDEIEMFLLMRRLRGNNV